MGLQTVRCLGFSISPMNDKLVVGTRLNEVYVYHKNERTWHCIFNPNDSSEGLLHQNGVNLLLFLDGDLAASYQYAQIIILW